MSAIPVPMTILQALADESLRRLELAPQIEHPGESGRAREQMLTAFIQQLIPSSFGVSTGFVVDALGWNDKCCVPAPRNGLTWDAICIISRLRPR